MRMPPNITPALDLEWKVPLVVYRMGSIVVLSHDITLFSGHVKCSVRATES